jgi:hypothetical protein
MSHWKQSNPDNEKSANLLLFLFGILIQGNRQQSAFRLSVNYTNTRLLRLDNRDSPGLIAAIKKGCKPKSAAFVGSSFRQNDYLAAAAVSAAM